MPPGSELSCWEGSSRSFNQLPSRYFRPFGIQGLCENHYRAGSFVLGYFPVWNITLQEFLSGSCCVTPRKNMLSILLIYTVTIQVIEI